MAEVLKHRLVELRPQKHPGRPKPLTITEVANEAGVSRQSLYTWIRNGHADMRGDTVVKLCHYFGVGVGELFYIGDDKEET